MKPVSKIYFFLSRAAIIAFFGMGLFIRCANTMAPQGGPRDSLPPVVVRMDPEFGTTNFTGKRIFIEFDEYIKLQDQQKEFFTSPFMTRKPSLLVKGRGVQIDMRDTLRENTTYALNFGSSVQDNNEGNPLHGLRYVFSTGDEIDSMVMSGFTVDGYTSDSLSKTFILFYEAFKDSVPEMDSTVFLSQADVVGRSEKNGIFIAENLKPVDYRIYALQDNNNNQTYEPGVDRIGFLDTVFNPLYMPPFDIWYDTLRQYLVAEPQLYFRLFMDEGFKRQYLVSSTRPLQNKIVLDFGAKYPEIQELTFFNIDTTKIIREDMTPYGDSIALWLHMPASEIPDTVKGEITYIRHDSVNELVSYTQALNLGWKFFETKDQERERERKEKEREQAIKEGKEPEKEPNPFKMKVEASSTLNPEKNIPIEFDYPLVRIDTSLITLIRYGDGEDEMYRVRYNLVQDTLNIRKYVISASWTNAQKYKLEIPAGTFENVAGEMNDSLVADFTIMDPEKYAKLDLKVIGKTDSSQYVLQLLDGNNRIINEIRHATTGSYSFNYVDAGTFKIRIIEDDNRNGIWDRGDLINRIQPERVEMFILENGETEITTKVNWTMDYDLDMNTIFAPITMEKINEQIRRTEEARIRKMLKDREKNQNRNTPARPQNSGAFNPTQGFGIN